MQSRDHIFVHYDFHFLNFYVTYLICCILNPLTQRRTYWGSYYSIFSFMCMFCRSFSSFYPFFFWPLCCLPFFDLRILFTPLVSSTSSYYFEAFGILLNLVFLFFSVVVFFNMYLIQSSITFIRYAHNNLNQIRS